MQCKLLNLGHFFNDQSFHNDFTMATNGAAYHYGATISGLLKSFFLICNILINYLSLIVLSGVHTVHDIGLHHWMPWRTMLDDTGRYNDTGRHRSMSSNAARQLLHANCCAVRVSHDLVRHHMTIDAQIEASSIFCVSVVVATYDIVRYVNRAVKSMCLITVTPDDIVRCRAQCEHNFRHDFCLHVLHCIASRKLPLRNVVHAASYMLLIFMCPDFNAFTIKN